MNKFRKAMVFTLLLTVIFSFTACKKEPKVVDVVATEGNESNNYEIKEINFNKTYNKDIGIDGFSEHITVSLPEDCKDTITVKNRGDNKYYKYDFQYKDTNYTLFSVILSKEKIKDAKKVDTSGNFSVYLKINEKVNGKSIDGVQINYLLDNISKITSTVKMTEGKAETIPVQITESNNENSSENITENGQEEITEDLPEDSDLPQEDENIKWNEDGQTGVAIVDGKEYPVQRDDPETVVDLN